MKGDCLERMKEIEDNSVDMIMADPPYGTTTCKWDSVISLELMWKELKRIIKKNSAIVMMGNQPFTTILISSNIKMFKYCWVWDKIIGVGFQLAKYRPMMRHEDIVVFCKSTPTYYPIKTLREKPIAGYATPSRVSPLLGGHDKKYRTYTDKHPTSIIIEKKIKNGIHPTQKPIALMEYLIKTYTNEDETVLDFCMGSGTTGLACKNLNRNFIGIELSEKDNGSFELAEKRIKTHKKRKTLGLLT
ncbi:hypothetical protein LCGC14_3157260 [marine sediment metagenome]|uniref:DNA methylase N-4/N-6 domain-containing protein n=1 Tax=marine sediment metagenome TaxID=412755 RepID=A0A0F8XZ27_9ZZZZ